MSSCVSKILSHPVLQAHEDPGSQKIKVPFATPAVNRERIVDVANSSYDTQRNNSPKPSISLSNKTDAASGVPSLPVSPVPPDVIIISIAESAIHRDSTDRIW